MYTYIHPCIDGDVSLHNVYVQLNVCCTLFYLGCIDSTERQWRDIGQDEKPARLAEISAASCPRT